MVSARGITCMDLYSVIKLSKFLVSIFQAPDVRFLAVPFSYDYFRTFRGEPVVILSYFVSPSLNMVTFV